MVIHKILVSDNFANFVEAFRYESDRRGVEIPEDRIENIYKQVVEACFQRYIGEDFGDIIEYIGNSITLNDDQGGVEHDHDAYMCIYENADIVEDIYTRLKYNGNGLFRGDGYGENIYLTLEFIDSQAYIVLNTETILFNTPIFTTVDGNDESTYMLELESEFLVFKSMFKQYMLNSFSHNSSEINDNDYIVLFAGLIELMIMHDDVNTDIDDIVDSLNQLLGEVVEMIDPHDTELYSAFYLAHTSYMDKLYTYIYSKTKNLYDIVSWGVLGDKVIIGLSERR